MVLVISGFDDIMKAKLKKKKNMAKAFNVFKNIYNFVSLFC